MREAILLLLSLPGVSGAIQSVTLVALAGRWQHEVGLAVERDGKHGHLAISQNYAEDKIVIDSNTVLIIHSHPMDSAQPSTQDVAEAIKTGIPDIVISAHAEWIAMPDGTIYQIK